MDVLHRFALYLLPCSVFIDYELSKPSTIVSNCINCILYLNKISYFCL